MKPLYRMVGARIAAILALASAVATLWFGWWALAWAAIFIVSGFSLIPSHRHPHQGRLRDWREALVRRKVKHAWRPRGP